MSCVVTAFGVGLATLSPGGGASRRADTWEPLEVWYPVVHLDDAPDVAATLASVVGHTAGAGTYLLTDAPIGTLAGDAPALAAARAAVTGEQREPEVDTGTRRRAVATFVDDLTAAPVDAYDVYLRLHLLSNRLVRPHGVNLDGAFGLLRNVAWTDLGPCDPDGFEQLRVRLAGEGRRVHVRSIDKFPRMTDYVLPSGVRIGDADRVRLGAHLAAGTTVMHEGFVNFNAGTLGASMIEGRISAGVVVGDGSDLGGGASVMGTLSGGGTEVVRIGENCLVGANAGIGISLGDGCVVEAGLYVTAGTRVTLPDSTVVKARELSGRPGLLFRRDSETGRVVALPREGSIADWGGLNVALHANE